MADGPDRVPELLYVARDLVEHIDERVAEFLDAYPEEERFELTLDEIQAFDEEVADDGTGHDELGGDTLEARWRDDPATIERHVTAAIAETIDDEAAATEFRREATTHVSGYDDEDVHDVGLWAPDDIAGSTIDVRGQATKRSERKLRDEVLAFYCVRCGTINRVDQRGEKMCEPHECRSCESNGPFNVRDDQSDMRDYQVVRLQTLPEEAEGTDTEMIDIRVFDDLVGTLAPGDRAIVTTEMKALREGDTRIRELYGEAHDITKLTSDHTDVEVEPYRDDIEEIASGNHPEYDDPYEAVIDNIAPFHEGDEQIKEAIAYQLFGGVEKDLPDGSWMRGNIHVLLVGDPGTGKTAIARYVKDLVPRSEYGTGKRSSGAGLTASAVKDDFADGGWTLQAGTLVRAHNGMAVIDELDKMDPEDRDGMIEAMSEQQVTIQMVVSGVLPAKCSVLSVANPKFGSFDERADIAAQLDLDDALLSRFDLKFLVTDEPDSERDAAVADTMTSSARDGQRTAAGKDPQSGSSTPAIPQEMFRAYIALSRRLTPEFTDDAADRVVSEYVELRQLNEDSDLPTPSTARQVEVIHRLSEASARIRLSDSITEDDVERAVSILYDSFESLGVDPESGALDVRQFEGGTSSSTQDRRRNLLAIVEGLTDDGSGAPYEEIVDEATALPSFDESDVERELEKLKQRADLYEPETNVYRRT